MKKWKGFNQNYYIRSLFVFMFIITVESFKEKEEEEMEKEQEGEAKGEETEEEEDEEEERKEGEGEEEERKEENTLLGGKKRSGPWEGFKRIEWCNIFVFLATLRACLFSPIWPFSAKG